MSFQYEVVTGLFQQDDPATDPASFDYTRDFGRLLTNEVASDPNRKPWDAFSQRIDSLNDSAPTGTQYAVVFLGRHGQGWHNVAESKYGTEAWDDYYSKLDSYDGMTFADAHLTETGRQQARLAHDTWERALADGLPAPQSYHVSPLHRCLETCSITFGGLALPAGRPFKPCVRELVREVIGEHTCDRRSTKQAITRAFPQFDVEEGFAEEDPFWRADTRETDAELDTRLRKFLDSVFEADTRSTYLSFTTHSGAIASILRVVGHRPFALQTGGVIPVVLKISKM